MTSSPDQSYDLSPEDPIPELPGSVRVGEDIEGTLDLVAADMYIQATNCVNEFGDFHLVLSHGPIQERLLIKMMVDPKYRAMPWSRTHVWSLAEDQVEPGNPAHSMTHWEQILADAGSISPEQLHAIAAHLPDAHQRAASELIEHLEWRERGQDRLDFILLDPQSLNLLIQPTPHQTHYGWLDEGSKIGMSLGCVNAARLIAVLAVGDIGREMLEEIEHDHTKIPLSPLGGHLRWYLDGYACSHTHDPYPNEECPLKERPENHR